MKIKSNIIKSEDYYSIRQIYKLNVFRWIKSYETLKRYIKTDLEKGNKVFNTIKSGKGTGTRYLIRGITLINLQQEIKKGKVFQ